MRLNKDPMRLKLDCQCDRVVCPHVDDAGGFVSVVSLRLDYCQRRRSVGRAWTAGSCNAFGFPFGFMAIVGTMGLVGVAINDSIVVLASIRANSASRAGNVVELTSSRVRVHTSRHCDDVDYDCRFSSVDPCGGGFWPPLAITIAGGVGGATVLALYFVPSLYLVLRGSLNVSADDHNVTELTE